MARYRGPVCGFCRREGEKLFLKGERCLTDKCSFDRRSYPPGMHGQRRSKLSEYGSQLREKQKVRRTYGMLEKQFRSEFEAASDKKGVTAETFFSSLELRLDNAVYRMGFGASRSDARQVVRHNHIVVNGRKLNIPSAKLKVGDEVSVREKSRTMARFAVAQELYSKRPPLRWLSVDGEKLAAKVTAVPMRDDIQMNVKERLIVELYSK